MPKENWQQRVEDLESLPDKAIWFAIRYLDPELKQKTPETPAFVALISVIILVCAIVFSLYLRGL